MLEKLDTIDWSKLTHAFGPADDVPAYIRALTSPIPTVWNEALENLRGTLMYLGGVYGAAIFAVPFYIKLVQNDTLQCRAELLKDLAHMGFRGERVEGDSPYDIFLRQLYDAVAQGLDTYIELIEGKQSELKLHALHVLDALREKRETSQVIDRIYTQFLKETDPQMKAGFVIYLSSRTEYLSEGKHLLSDLLRTDKEHPLVKIVAAQMQFRYSQEPISHETLLFLLDILTHPSLLEERYKALPWQYCNDLVGFISDMLPSLGNDIANLAIPALLKRLAYLEQCYQLRVSNPATDTDKGINMPQTSIQQEFATPSIVRALLYLAFQGKQAQANTTPFFLTTTQRIVLTATLNSNIMKSFPYETEKNLEKFGLPDHQKLAILLQLN